MFRLSHNCILSQASKVMAQNPSSQASTVSEQRTSRCSSWIQKRQRKQRSNCHYLLVIEKATEVQKNIYFCFIDYAKVSDCVGHNKLQKILQEMGIPGHFIFLLRNPYECQEATVRIGHGTMDQFKTGKGIQRGFILSLCLFNLYAEYIMQNVELDEGQVEIKTAGRNINNLRYADITTLMAEGEEEPKSLLIR